MLENEMKLGFGCMRLPMDGERIDQPAFEKMVDTYIAAGGRYFDTAHNYINEQSEPALRKALVERYPRDSYYLTSKLTCMYFDSEEEVRPFFELQLKTCGVEYFDFYLFHAMSMGRYEKALRCKAFEQMQQLKAEGRVKHIGMSFHDTPEVLEYILQREPCIEIVQLQLNYADYDNPDVQSQRCYEVCEKYGKPVLVMEPVKGGRLAQLPPEAAQLLAELGQGSAASYAIRYCASHSNVAMVLSGMSDQAQMEDNLSYMKEFKPFTDAEYAAVAKVRELLRKMEQIPCTACRYCMDVCPQQIRIPELFSAWNNRKLLLPWEPVETPDPKSCLDCGACENTCPQHLEIRKLLRRTGSVVKK